MSFDYILIFAGRFLNCSPINSIGKNLYIPLTEKHAALTFKITGQSFSNVNDMIAIRIAFNSEEEREAVATCDFSNEIFFVE